MIREDDDFGSSLANAGDIALTVEELSEAEAAVTLALLPDGDPMPAHVRDRVTSGARAFLGSRAKDYAIRRAGDTPSVRAKLVAPRAVSNSRGMQSTTSAGSHVMASFDDPVAEASSPSKAVFAWGGWAFAAAAGIAFFISQTVGQKGGGGESPMNIQQISLRSLPSSAHVGEMLYDRANGTCVVKLPHVEAIHRGEEALELWVAFDGDPKARPVALLDAESTEVTLGRELPLCQGKLSSAPPGAHCASIREAVITREKNHGSLIFDAERVVFRGSSSSR